MRPCHRVTFFLLAVSLDRSYGWWISGPTNQTAGPKPQKPAKSFFERMPGLESWSERFENGRTWLRELSDDFDMSQWDSAVWWCLDSIVSVLGWLLFGSAWGSVRNGCRRVVQVGLILLFCIATHYVWAVCYPIVSLLAAIVVAAFWVLRRLLKTVGTVFFQVQKWSGGAPEATGVEFHGPLTGKTPETATLRSFKRSGDADKLMVVKRGNQVAVLAIGGDSQTIRSHGLHVPVETDSIRGDPGLVSVLKRVDKIHLCRHEPCTEGDGEHFGLYGLVKGFQPEQFQVSQAEEGAKRLTQGVWNWIVGDMANKAKRVASRVREYASESEAEDEPAQRCQADLICWEDAAGGHVLSNTCCKEAGEISEFILKDDCPRKDGRVVLCPKHVTCYVKTRGRFKCSFEGCNHFGDSSNSGIRLCSKHASELQPPGPSSSTRRQRSRSRTRERETHYQPDEPYGITAARAQGSGRCDGDWEEDDDVENGPGLSARLLREAQLEDPPSTRRRRRDGKGEGWQSPGNTPKSSIHRNLARMGLLDSPGERGSGGPLERFMECLAEGKPMGVTEEKVRERVARERGQTAEELLRELIEAVGEEQSKGQRGLTKFQSKWKAELRELEGHPHHPRKDTDSWSVIPSAPATPRVQPTAEEEDRQKGDGGSGRKGDGVRIAPPGIFKGDRKAGAVEGASKPADQVTQIAEAIKHQTQELATLVRHQAEGSGSQPAGTLKGLSRTHEEIVFLIRACGQYEVALGGGDHGQALANSLIAAQVGASTRLRQAGFKQKMTQRLAVGIAGAHWGVHEKHCLSASEFVCYTDAELDAFASEMRGTKNHGDQRPPPPTRLDEWVSRAKRQNEVWALVYGQEWKPVKNNAVDLLAEWHQSSPHKWPLGVIVDIWEEIHWRFVEEVKQIIRDLKKEVGRETMTLSEIKFHCLLPGVHGEAWLTMPTTFDLERPGSWFQEEIVPRIERKQERLLWNLTWQGAKKDRAVAGTSSTASAGTMGDGGDRGDRPTLKALWGPKLTPEEVNRAKERAPQDRQGKLLCWGNLTHMGCHVAGCQRSHDGLRGPFEQLDHCVQMQLLKRGGLKRMRVETKDTVNQKIKDLRTTAAKDKSDKVQDGRKRGKAAGQGGDEPVETTEKPEEGTEGGRAGGASRVAGESRKVTFWEVPEEFQVDYTKEEDLGKLVIGPDSNWGNSTYVPQRQHPGRNGESAPVAARDLLEVVKGLHDGEVLAGLRECEVSDDLYAWASTRVAMDPATTLEQLMTEMATYGLGELAKEASDVLEQRGDFNKAGSSRLHVFDTVWTSGQPGQGGVEIDGKRWRLWDFQEEVQMTEEIASLLQQPEPQRERRQCVTLTLAAGVLWKEKGGRPTLEDVQERAQCMREEQLRQAVEAERQMNLEARSEMVSAIEHELRVYVHDIVTVHHEKDFRCLAVFPLQELQDVTVVVVRADHRGGLVVETIVGSQWVQGGPMLVCLIWKGHMTLLQPPDDHALHRLLEGEDVISTPALGFSFYWHSRHDQPRTAPFKLHCRLCQHGKRAGGSDPSVRRCSQLSHMAVLSKNKQVSAAIVRQVKELPGIRAGRLVLQEVFAGTGRISEAWAKAGCICEPIELYDDPLLQTGARPHHDLLRPEVRERLLQSIRDGHCNVGWLAAPCTSFCDWQQKNGGSRSFQFPCGEFSGPLQSTEEQGNILGNFAADFFELMLDTGGFPVAESSGTSSRYPKMWNLPRWRAILQREDVDWVQFPMCAFQLGPPDQETAFYVHCTRVVFPKHEPLRNALLRQCPGVTPDHQHVPLKGARPGCSVSRCREAGQYAWNFVHTVVSVLQSTLNGGGQTSSQDARAGSGRDSDFEFEWSGSENEVLLPGGGGGEESAIHHTEEEASPPASGSGEAGGGAPEVASSGGAPEVASGSAGGDEVRPNNISRTPVVNPTATTPVGGDYWTQNSPAYPYGCIVRRHNTPRTTLYVPSEIGLPTPLNHLRSARRTVLVTDRGVQVVIEDDWREEGEVNVGYGHWTGLTIFVLRGQDLPAPDFADPENYYFEDDWETDDEIGPGPGGCGGRRVSRKVMVPSGGSGEPDQRAGGGKGKGVRPVYQAPNTEARYYAQNYVKVIDEEFGNTAEGWNKAVVAGNQLLEAAGTVAEAAKSLWEVREQKGMMNLEGVDHADFDEILHPTHLEYLRDVRHRGMAARFEGKRARVRAGLHPNAKRHLEQVFVQVAKDVGKHRVLVADADHPLLEGTIASPFEAVDKMMPDRSLSVEKRIVHDQRGVNGGTSKFFHPPALQPAHVQISRRILWEKHRAPGVPILMAKKDISGAFRLLWVSPEDVELFAGELPWKPQQAFPEQTEAEKVDVGFREVVIYLVSSFGFSGSPGEWCAWGRATEEFHRAHRPAEPLRDSARGFDAKVLVDDCILVEPWIGLRPWVSAEVFEDGVRRLLGSKAVNVEKDAIEGSFKTSQTVWGVVMETDTMKAFLPEKRIQKGAALLQRPAFDHGEMTVTLKELQQFRGIMTGWAAIIPSLQNELGACDKFLGGLDGGAVAQPKLRGEGKRLAELQWSWEDLWELFEVCRWLSARSETWDATFSTSLKSMLPPLERVGLPGEWEGSVFVSSDATTTKVGAIDWKNGKVFRADTLKVRVWAEKALGHLGEELDQELVIHLGEMLSFLAFACHVGKLWTDQVVVYGGDNKIVKFWLQTRKAKVRAGRILIRVLNMLEMRFHFSVLAGWWRTFHNVDADFITRCTDSEFHKMCEQKGWEEVDVS